MNRTRTLWAGLLVLGITGTTRGEIPRPDDAPRALSPEESARRFKVPAGFRIELVASEPLLHEPSGVCWDERGQLFVSELHGRVSPTPAEKGGRERLLAAVAAWVGSGFTRRWRSSAGS